jgi:hypothetical protein
MTLSASQVAVMNEVLAGAPGYVIDVAAKIGRGEVVPDQDAEAVVDALANAMLGDEGFDGEGLTEQGNRIDDLIGIVQQMSEHFYD